MHKWWMNPLVIGAFLGGVFLGLAMPAQAMTTWSGSGSSLAGVGKGIMDFSQGFNQGMRNSLAWGGEQVKGGVVLGVEDECRCDCGW